MKIKTYYIMFFLFLLYQNSYGQTKVQVVEKTINKNINLTSTEVFGIAAEKADIVVKGWNENHVGLQIIFSAKHTDKQVAEKELNYMKYSLSREDNKIEVRNTFILPANVSQIQSSLNVSYKLFVPQKCTLNIIDKYGTIDMSSLRGTITINSEFADIRLNKIEGVIVIQNSFAELRGSDVKGTFNCKSEKSEIYMSDIEGSYNFITSFGSIDLEFEEKVKSLSIKGDRTSVLIRPKSFQSYTYDLATKHGTIYVPEAQSNLVKKEFTTSLFRYYPDTKRSLIKIQTTYSPITIKF